tara:strand:+ start:90 stop:467 length:378 start_codon:yes stop_codon:yes gene_type:complete
MIEDCIFCNLPEDRIIKSYDQFNIIRDLYPVTYLHSLVIPKRHVENYFDLYQEELYELNFVLKELKFDLEKIDKKISGFNIGINIGKDAGQTIFHCHIHVIPRRRGDVEEPRGGVRGVIANKQNY